MTHQYQKVIEYEMGRVPGHDAGCATNLDNSWKGNLYETQNYVIKSSPSICDSNCRSLLFSINASFR